MPVGDHLMLSFLEDADFMSARSELLRKKIAIDEKPWGFEGEEH